MVSIDITIDINGRYVTNAIVGVLSSNLKQNNMYLINTQFLQKVNSNTIATFFDDSMRLISANYNSDDVSFFVTDVIYDQLLYVLEKIEFYMVVNLSLFRKFVVTNVWKCLIPVNHDELKFLVHL